MKFILGYDNDRINVNHISVYTVQEDFTNHIGMNNPKEFKFVLYLGNDAPYEFFGLKKEQAESMVKYLDEFI